MKFTPTLKLVETLSIVLELIRTSQVVFYGDLFAAQLRVVDQHLLLGQGQVIVHVHAHDFAGTIQLVQSELSPWKSGIFQTLLTSRVSGSRWTIDQLSVAFTRSQQISQRGNVKPPCSFAVQSMTTVWNESVLAKSLSAFYAASSYASGLTLSGIVPPDARRCSCISFTTSLRKSTSVFRSARIVSFVKRVD